jgi:hypothetical protein
VFRFEEGAVGADEEEEEDVEEIDEATGIVKSTRRKKKDIVNIRLLKSILFYWILNVEFIYRSLLLR